MKSAVTTSEAIKEWEAEAVKRIASASEFKAYQVWSVATVQADLLRSASILFDYAIMLDNRNTLEVEGFLVEKLEFVIALLKNSQGRIKAATK